MEGILIEKKLEKQLPVIHEISMENCSCFLPPFGMIVVTTPLQPISQVFPATVRLQGRLLFRGIAQIIKSVC
jgi:hypothetical protein